MLKRIEVELTRYGTIIIPKDRRNLFPDCWGWFPIESDTGEDKVRVMKHPPSWPPHIHLKKTKWFKKHSEELKYGDKLIIEVIEPMKKYHLELLTEDE